MKALSLEFVSASDYKYGYMRRTLLARWLVPIVALTTSVSVTPVCFSSAYASALTPANFPDLVEKVLPGVVNVSSTTVSIEPVYGMDEFMRFWGIPQERKQTSLGSGFIINKDGFMITNNHVVRDAKEVVVTLYDKRQFKAKIVGTDQKVDLALLQIRDDHHKVPGNLSPVPLGDSDAVRIAESTFAVGNPFGLQHTVTAGIISAKNRTIGQGPFDDFIQTDASINPGNSGGPLFNSKGEVIGINTVIYSRTGQSGGLGFAIPINEAKRIIPDLQRYGRVPRPWLGILGERMTPQLQQYYQLGTSKGVFIYNLVDSGPGDQAGLRQGDVVQSIQGTEISEPYDIERALAKLKPKDTATVRVQRGRSHKDIAIKLEELPRLENLPQGIM
jgi:serine protease Do